MSASYILVEMYPVEHYMFNDSHHLSLQARKTLSGKTIETFHIKCNTMKKFSFKGTDFPPLSSLGSFSFSTEESRHDFYSCSPKVSYTPEFYYFKENRDMKGVLFFDFFPKDNGRNEEVLSMHLCVESLILHVSEKILKADSLIINKKHFIDFLHDLPLIIMFSILGAIRNSFVCNTLSIHNIMYIVLKYVIFDLGIELTESDEDEIFHLAEMFYENKHDYYFDLETEAIPELIIEEVDNAKEFGFGVITKILDVWKSSLNTNSVKIIPIKEKEGETRIFLFPLVTKEFKFLIPLDCINENILKDLTETLNSIGRTQENSPFTEKTKELKECMCGSYLLKNEKCPCS